MYYCFIKTNFSILKTIRVIILSFQIFTVCIFFFYFRNLADVSNDNILSVEEFVLAMHLILKIKDGLPLPKSLPKHLVPKVVPIAEMPDISRQEREAYQNVFNKVTQEEINGK